MIIKINEEIDKSLWNKFSKNKTFFRFEWFFIIKNTYNLEPLFILIYKDDKFALIASIKTIKGYVSLPFVSYSGFLSNDEIILKKLKTYLVDKNINIDSRDLIEKEVSEGYVNPIVHIPTFDYFWKNISSNTRNQFKRSEKSNLKINTEMEISSFYSIFSIGMKNLGTPVHSKDFFFNLEKYLPCKIFTLFDSDVIVGSMFCVYDDDTLSVMFAYVLPQYNSKYANYYLYLNAIKWLTKNNLQYLDLGRSTYNQGTFHFKKKFKPKMYSISSEINYSKSNLSDITKVWSKIPLAITNFLGPKLRKYLP